MRQTWLFTVEKKVFVHADTATALAVFPCIKVEDSMSCQHVACVDWYVIYNDLIKEVLYDVE